MGVYIRGFLIVFLKVSQDFRSFVNFFSKVLSLFHYDLSF